MPNRYNRTSIKSFTQIGGTPAHEVLSIRQRRIRIFLYFSLKSRDIPDLRSYMTFG